MSDMSLDQLMDESVEFQTEEEPTTEATEEVTASAEEEAKPEETTEEPTGDDDDSTPESNTDEDTEKQGQLSALKAERAKRQDLERQLNELKSQFEKPQEPETAPDAIDDPEGFHKHIAQQIEQESLKNRITMSQELMRSQHADYDEKEAKFLELAQSDQSLIVQMKSHAMPAKFVMDTVNKHERFSKFDSFDDALKAEVEKTKSDIEKQVEERLRAEYEAKLKKAQGLPPSGAGGSQESDNTTIQNMSLGDILGEKS